jgi:hypothetical protein
MQTSHTTKTVIIILIVEMCGFTRNRKEGLGTGCRETTIPGKFATGAMKNTGTMATTIIMTDNARADCRSAIKGSL